MNLDEVFCLCPHQLGKVMSVAMLSSVSSSFYRLAGALPVSATSATSAITTGPVNRLRHVDRDEDRPRLRENTLVTAMMAAFQALGVGQPATSSATGTTPPAVPTSAAAPAVTSTTTTTSAAATPSTPAANTTPSTTATTATEAAPSADTLEKAVNEFAHALFSMLHRQERGGHSDGDRGGEHAHRHEGRRSGGYNGFVQRLEQLAQSLGTAPAAAAGASTAVPDTTPPVTQTTETPATPATTSTVPSTDTVAPAPSRGVTRLLAAFSKVLNLLQPPVTSTGTPTPADTTTTPSTGTATSTADKLKLFLTTLAQALHSGAATAPPSAVGSRVDVTV